MLTRSPIIHARDLAKDARYALSIGGLLMPVGRALRGDGDNWRAFSLFEDKTAVELTYTAAARGFVRTDVSKK